MNGIRGAPGLPVLAASGLIFAVLGAQVARLPKPGVPAEHLRSQERQIQRSISIPDALAAAYADGTRSPGGSPGPDYWQLQVNYVIHATLDPPTSVVTARESIVLHNTSEDVLDEVRMRFDQNLFREDAASRMDIPNHTEGMVVTSLSIDGAAMSVPPGPETTRRFPLARPLAPADSSTTTSVASKSSWTFPRDGSSALPEPCGTTHERMQRSEPSGTSSPTP